MLFKEVITVYSENHTKPINILCGQIEDLSNDLIYGTYSYHSALKFQHRYFYIKEILHSRATYTMNLSKSLVINSCCWD
jgi:hypothetical protein